MPYPIDPILAAALSSRSRQRVCRADVLAGGVPVLSGLRITSGSVTVNGSQSPRRSATVAALDVAGDLAASDASDVLAPYGDELALYRGLRIGGIDYTAPVGVFRIQRADTAWSGGAVAVSCTLADRSASVSADKFIDYVTLPADMLVTDAIRSIVAGSLTSGQTYAFAPLTQVITQQVYAPGDNRWDAATKLAQDVGCLLFFDAAGTLTLTPVPDPRKTAPAWQFNVNEAGILTAAASSLTREQAVNVVVAQNSGTGVDTPSSAIAQDNDPNSPTYVGGKFGRQVAVVNTNLSLDAAGLQNFATSQLLLNLGATQQATISAMCVPHLEAFDVISVNVDKVGLAASYAIDQMTVPMGGGAMSITTRGVVVQS